MLREAHLPKPSLVCLFGTTAFTRSYDERLFRSLILQIGETSPLLHNISLLKDPHNAEVFLR